MATFEQVKDAVKVLSHVQLRCAQTGGTVGLLIAIPGLTLAPMKVNRADDPPVIAAASLALTGAMVTSGIVIPMTLGRLWQVGTKGVTERAELLGKNRVQRQVDVAAMVGATVGLSLEGVRIRSIASSEGRSALSVATSKEGMWEILGMAVAGMAASTVCGVLSKKVIDTVSGLLGYGEVKHEKMQELDEADETGIADLLPGSGMADSGTQATIAPPEIGEEGKDRNDSI